MNSLEVARIKHVTLVDAKLQRGGGMLVWDAGGWVKMKCRKGGVVERKQGRDVSEKRGVMRLRKKG